ncbi:RDD family protein [Pseudoalteromonas citrea]|nr:RDD family protein [Pseudoalteromonas citrea]
MDYKPNFSDYTYDELLDAEKHIDKVTYPERYEEIIRLLNDPEHLSKNKSTTSEKIEVSKYSTFWLRFLAALVDSLIFIPLIFLDEWFFSQGYSGVSNFIFYSLISSLSYFIYTVYMHGKYGQTIGKMVLNIKVTSVDDSKWGFKKAFYRDSVIIGVAVLILIMEAPHILTDVNPLEAAQNNPVFNYLMYAQLIWFLAEFITMLTNNKRRAIHDFIAGSVVIRL